MKIQRSSVYTLVLTILLVFTFTLGFNNWAAAVDVNATDVVNVSVTIGEKCIVDISPSELNWSTPIDPGGTGAYKKIQIENLGSVNLTYVWFNNSYPLSDPFGTGLSTAYDSGNFMTISKDSDGLTYYFPNRVDYNASYEIIYLKGPGGNQPPTVPYGRFRNSSFEYFWAVTAGTTNYTDGNFYISDTPHTQSQTGDADLSDNSANSLTTVTTGSEAGDWGVANVTVNGMDLCVAVYYDGSKAMFYKWNMDAPGAQNCANADYFVNETADGAITPGASAYARVSPYVPYGVVYNSTNPEILGTITVIVSAS